MSLSPEREAQIREEVRQRIAAEESDRIRREEARAASEREFHEEQLRQRIVDEETRAYYENSPDYFEFINENGDSEWLTRKQILAREGYFDYEEHVEDPDRGRRFVTLRFFAYGLLSLLLMGSGILYMLDDPATLHVLCNVQGAEILIDGQPREERTDARIELAAGEHLVEVRHLGYVPDGEAYRVIEVKDGESSELSFRLKAAR
jgi:hypothetical protein